MRFSILSAALAASTASATYVGFNYGSTFTNGAAKKQSDFETEFNKAKSLAGTNGEFTSARLYTMIQAGTTNTPISAIPAAINTKTSLLLGLWASSGQADFTNELDALASAINQYGTDFTSLIAGISVGSEDLYRNSPTGILANGYNEGADPDVIVDFIRQTKAAIAGTKASGASVGHVDTWTAWVNGSNSAVISACDWLGMDAYPYFQNTMANSIDIGNTTFFNAYDATLGVSQGKSVWVTETGWPVSGPQENQAVASIPNAETYWQQTGCTLFGNINTWWYTLQDSAPTTPSPSFGIIGSDINGSPLYDLTCKNGNKPSASSVSRVSSAVSTASSATAPASSAGPNTESLSQASPAPESSPTSTITVSVSSAPAVSTTAKTTATSAGSASSSPVSITSTASAGGKTSTTYQTTMVTITSCPSGCTSSSAASIPVPTISSSAPAPPAPSSSSCPANLKGDYQYPHLIVPIDKWQPNKAYGTSYNGTITPSISTIFNFDIPASYAGKTCSLIFLFPTQAALETSAFTFNGQGGLAVSELKMPADQGTTYANAPAVAAAVGGAASVMPGNSYTITSHACAAGSRMAFEFSSAGGLDLTYFQDYNPSPIGAYITAC